MRHVSPYRMKALPTSLPCLCCSGTGKTTKLTKLTAMLFLFRNGRKLTAGKISKVMGVSHEAANNSLERLRKLKLLLRRSRNSNHSREWVYRKPKRGETCEDLPPPVPVVKPPRPQRRRPAKRLDLRVTLPPHLAPHLSASAVWKPKKKPRKRRRKPSTTISK